MYIDQKHETLPGLRPTTPPAVRERGLETTSVEHLKKSLTQELKERLV